MKNVSLTLTVLLLIYIVFAYIRFKGHGSAARELIDKAVPYEQHPSQAQRRVLILGDSTAAGTGASDPKFTTAGRFGSKYPDADIENLGVNGSRLEDVIEQAKKGKGREYDVVISQAGGNDILHFTPLAEVENSLRRLADELRELSPKVILIHGGNMGASPAFPFGTKSLFSWRTRKVREIFIRVSAQKGVKYVDLYTSLKDFPQVRNGNPTSASDGFHPSDEGYAIWFEYIDKKLSEF